MGSAVLLGTESLHAAKKPKAGDDAEKMDGLRGCLRFVTPKLWDFSHFSLRFRFLLRATDVTPSFHFANLCTGNP